MNNWRNPRHLKELCEEKFCSLIYRPFVIWTKTLSVSEAVQWRIRLIVFQLMLKQCVELKEYLMSLPELACKLLMEKIFKTVSAIIASYHLALCSRLRNLDCRLQYEEVCLYMLRVVFLPCIKECNIRDIQNVFVQELVSQSLQTNPNITRLILPHIPTTKVENSVLSSFESLAVLQEFNSEFGCTNDIVIELGKHCKLLKVLDITGSKLVTNGCVQYILNMQNLEKLYVSESSISETCYALLISNLPRIQNITWKGPVDFILRKITKISIPSVNEFVGAVSDASLVRKVCPHVKYLSVCIQTGDAWDLVNLNNVEWLEFTSCDYNIQSLGIVFKYLGKRLVKLDMAAVKNVDITQIIRYCTVLEIFNVGLCEIVISEIFPLTTELRHFKSVKEIALVCNQNVVYFLKILHLYENLESFYAEGVADLEHNTLSEIINAGGFRKLSKIRLCFCGLLTLQTALLLIGRCGNLLVIGNLSAWYGVSVDDQNYLFDFVLTNNLALSVV
ncbi:uncharacterized protein LOC110835590 [Zootermopsis nevadensis]|uniref:Uncharacterized protein n=1 Tax=Zootermopsis nevadensis TaxID=136037 RepID=A0A067QT81_ZOONE|nr:uncharacterized protein LOC110835590 [Zootermopsis nevadensis]XP_021931637.1 uncharacterized protein LOC110835590 [Zootermopsis nevadensis]KDR13191.1 hypothetical protein L798_12988 [Zootermopsis nevadensis]